MRSNTQIAKQPRDYNLRPIAVYHGSRCHEGTLQRFLRPNGVKSLNRVLYFILVIIFAIGLPACHLHYDGYRVSKQFVVFFRGENANANFVAVFVLVYFNSAYGFLHNSKFHAWELFRSHSYPHPFLCKLSQHLHRFNALLRSDYYAYAHTNFLFSFIIRSRPRFCSCISLLRNIPSQSHCFAKNSLHL